VRFELRSCPPALVQRTQCVVRTNRARQLLQLIHLQPRAGLQRGARLRRQLSKHHPDKLKANGLPDSMLEHAKQRTQQIIEAYELIKSSRQR